MSSFLIRPRFIQIVEFDAETIRAKLTGQVERDGGRVDLICFPDCICLRIPESDRHFWSPRLSLSFECLEGGKNPHRGHLRT